MAFADRLHVAMMAMCVLLVMSVSRAVEVPAENEGGLPGEDSVPVVEAPAGEDKTSEEKRDAKRSGQYCYVEGRVFRHGEVFTYPGFSHCIKYRCLNGGYNMVQAACEKDGQCVAVGAVYRGRCRSLRCIREHNYFRFEPTAYDKCNAEGKCVEKNRPFVHSDCHKYQCFSTPNGGYDFRLLAAQCKDDYGRCVSVGQYFSKVINGHRYTNCVCLHGGGISCRG